LEANHSSSLYLAKELLDMPLSLPERDGADYQRAEIRRDEGTQILMFAKL
jgi:hypothetical protein